MQINAHRPTVTEIATLDNEPDKPFHTIRLKDSTGGQLTLFIRCDWSDWDAIVAKVEEYRSTQGDGHEAL